MGTTETEQSELKIGQLLTAASVKTFVLGGNATFTLVSVKTQARYTYKARQPDPSMPHFVSVMFGSDNEDDFATLGTIFSTGVYKHNAKKSNMGADDVRNMAFAWMWAQVQANKLPASLEVWHEGRCCRCNRKLTVPASIANGIGPECAKKSNGFMAEAA